MNANIDDVVTAVMPSFVGSNQNHIKSAILNYMDINAFAYSPVMTESSYQRLIEIIKFAGELDQNANVKFEDVIDNTLAKKTVEYFGMF